MSIVKKINIQNIETSHEGVQEFVTQIQGLYSGTEGKDEIVDLSSEKVCLEKVASPKEFFEKNGELILNPELVYFPIIQEVLKRYLGLAGGISVQETFQESILKMYTLRMNEYLSSGYYSDLIVDSAFNEKFNFYYVRKFLYESLSFIQYLCEGGLAEFPIDVEYGFSENNYFVQMIFESEDLNIKNLTEAFKEEDNRAPYANLIMEMANNANFLEIYKIEKTSKVSILGVFNKADERFEDAYFPSVLIHSISGFQASDLNLKHGVTTKVEYLKESTALKNAKLPGDGTENYNVSLLDKASNLISVKRVTDFVKLVGKDKNYDFQNLTIEDLDLILETYPDQKSLSSFTKVDKSIVIKALKEDLFYEALKDNVQIIEDSINEDEYLDSVLSSLENLDENEAVFALNGQRFTEDVTIVSGDFDEKDDTKTVIKGVTQSIGKDVWKVKQLNVVEKVRGQINDLRGRGASKEEINNRIKSIVEAELGVDESAGQSFIKYINEDANEGSFEEVASQNIVDIRAKLELEKTKKSLRTRDAQIGKMKKLIDTMKDEISLLRKETGTTEVLVKTSVNEDSLIEEATIAKEENEILKTELSELKKESKNIEIQKDREIEKIQNEIFEYKKEIETLRKRSETQQNEINTSTVNTKESIQIEKENKSLSLQVDSLKNKINFLMESRKSAQSSNVGIKEFEVLKENYSKKEKEVDAFQKENSKLNMIIKDLEKKVSISETNLGKVKDQSSEVKAAEAKLKAKDIEVEKYKKERLAFEEKLKEMQVEVKKQEVKMKFMAAQAEGAKSQNGQSSGGANPQDQKLAQLAKKLENDNKRLQMAAKKVSDELTEKKAELNKLKMDKKTSESKVRDLERKLAVLSKKVAA